MNDDLPDTHKSTRNKQGVTACNQVLHERSEFTPVNRLSRPDCSVPAASKDGDWQRLPTDAARVEICWQDTKITAREGDTVAAALLAAGISPTRINPVSNEARAVYCMMGVCFECMVEVNGVTEQACMIPVTEGMEIKPLSVGGGS